MIFNAADYPALELIAEVSSIVKVTAMGIGVSVVQSAVELAPMMNQDAMRIESVNVDGNDNASIISADLFK